MADPQHRKVGIALTPPALGVGPRRLGAGIPMWVRDHEGGKLAQLALLGVALIWGWTFVLVKESLREIGPFAFLFYRFMLASIILLILSGPRLKRVEARVWLEGALIGVALFGGYAFQTWGLRYTTATNSAFISGLAVVFVPLLGAGLLRERIGWRAWLGALLAVGGLGLIVFGGAPTVSLASLNRGDLLTLGCALSVAWHILLIGRLARPQTYVPLLVMQIGVVTLLNGAGMLAVEAPVLPRSGVVWKGIVITGVFATALALWAQNRFQPYTTAARTAILLASEPVFAAALGYWLLGERLVGWQGLGALLILGVILLSHRRPGL